MPMLMPVPGVHNLPLPDICLTSAAAFEIRPAKVKDVHGISALINQYAAANVMLARGPQYLYQHIQDYMVALVPTSEAGGETVVACGGLHVVWEDLAEIRSVAVHADCQKYGLGKMLVQALVKRCQFLGIPQIFVFTLVDKFFRNCGFSEFDRNLLPPAVWVECSKCPKFYRCDEICMLLHI